MAVVLWNKSCRVDCDGYHLSVIAITSDPWDFAVTRSHTGFGPSPRVGSPERSVDWQHCREDSRGAHRCSCEARRERSRWVFLPAFRVLTIYVS
ncbi:hypothetical protein N806_17440 [Rhodococcus sp. P27]|nr:hypothetical protein N806_17440 [Rhodococcus sp. P27]